MPASLTPAECQALAQHLAAARQPGAAKLPTPARCPASAAEAYQIQDAVMALLGTHAVAWKVGAASPTSEPNCAPIFAGLVHPASDPIPGVASTGVELEIAFTLAQGFPAGPVAPTRAAVEAAIGTAHIVLETCAARVADGLKAPELLRLADNGINHGLVIGPEVKNWRGFDAKALAAKIESNDTTIVDLTGGHTHPDLIGLLTWLVGHCVTQRGGIPAGTIVTTGSWTSIRFVDTPAKIRATFSGLGVLETQIAPM
jgi:2-keto-4-pentenoate hydratase